MCGSACAADEKSCEMDERTRRSVPSCPASQLELELKLVQPPDVPFFSQRVVFPVVGVFLSFYKISPITEGGRVSVAPSVHAIRTSGLAGP